MWGAICEPSLRKLKMHTSLLFSFKNTILSPLYLLASPVLSLRDGIGPFRSAMPKSIQFLRGTGTCPARVTTKCNFSTRRNSNATRTNDSTLVTARATAGVSPFRDATKEPNNAEKESIFFVNVRFVGVGFRAYVVKKVFKDTDLSLPVQFSQETFALEGKDSIKSKKGDENTRFLHEEDGKKALRFLMLKVGQSALTAYPIPKGIGVYCPKDQQADKDAILLTGNNLQELKQITAEIKSYKTPDPYKGSGIYQSQRIETDEGEIFENEKVFRKVMKKK